jgi:hypothetical protein
MSSDAIDLLLRARYDGGRWSVDDRVPTAEEAMILETATAGEVGAALEVLHEHLRVDMNRLGVAAITTARLSTLRSTLRRADRNRAKALADVAAVGPHVSGLEARLRELEGRTHPPGRLAGWLRKA